MLREQSSFSLKRVFFTSDLPNCRSRTSGCRKNLPDHSPKGFNEREIKIGTTMNMVKVFIKGQEDKELSSFLRYYPTRIKNVGIDGVFDRQTIFDFKDGCNQTQVAQFVAKELVRKFGRKVGKVVFSCVPASSQERNESRNKAFSALVCQLSGAIDGFSHVKVSGERSAVHGTKIKKEVRANRLEEGNTIEVDANFFRNKMVCIWDDVVTIGTSFCTYTAQLERVGAHVTNGIFLGKTSYRYVPTYE
ncbi:MAG: ribonucleotide-diphosphate reductase subunit alpha [Bacteroidaceae bacterium]|nr:ribonucleotide-diphosphate reductase subunit alpha [Bacteroidaceae bacterium]